MFPMPTSVSASPTTSPALRKPMKAMKESDAAGNCGVKLVGNGAQNHLRRDGFEDPRNLFVELAED